MVCACCDCDCKVRKGNFTVRTSFGFEEIYNALTYELVSGVVEFTDSEDHLVAIFPINHVVSIIRKEA